MRGNGNLGKIIHHFESFRKKKNAASQIVLSLQNFLYVHLEFISYSTFMLLCCKYAMRDKIFFTTNNIHSTNIHNWINVDFIELKF